MKEYNNKKSKQILRVILSPIILSVSLLITFGLTLVPILPLMAVLSLLSVLVYPFIYLLKKSGAELDYPEPYLQPHDHYLFKNELIAHLAISTVILWIPFYEVYLYVKTGELVLIKLFNE